MLLPIFSPLLSTGCDSRLLHNICVWGWLFSTSGKCRTGCSSDSDSVSDTRNWESNWDCLDILIRRKTILNWRWCVREPSFIIEYCTLKRTCCPTWSSMEVIVKALFSYIHFYYHNTFNCSNTTLCLVISSNHFHARQYVLSFHPITSHVTVSCYFSDSYLRWTRAPVYT